MKVEVKHISKTKKYPWIGIANDHSVIIFHEFNTGLVLRRGDSHFEQGFWSNVWNENDFEILNGEVMLSND